MQVQHPVNFAAPSTFSYMRSDVSLIFFLFVS